MRITFVLFLIGSFFVLFGKTRIDSTSTVQILNEKYQTERNENDNVDSPAFWKGKNGEAWLISTAKSTDLLIVDDAVSGKNIMRIGSKGTGLGKFKRPNGIAVIDSFLFVVERDNHRVQVLTLPSFRSIGTFGDSLLLKPYGIFVSKEETGYNVFITDNYEFAKDIIPPDSLLGKRVHKYFVNVSNNSLKVKLLRYFGETKGTGVLRIVESIYGDTQKNIVLIAEEDTSRSEIKIYDMEGRFLDSTFGKGVFKGQIEGIALYEENDNGFWIITDQSHYENIFHIFERTTFRHLCAFKGAETTNTDGIWLTKQSFGNFVEGALFAVHNDGNVSAFDLAEIKKLTSKINN